MPYRRKGGSALMALARRRRLKAAKDKEGTLDAMIIKPALSRLRTGVVSKRKKGGQALVALAKRRKKPAVKPAEKPASSQPSKFGARIPVESRSPATKAQQPKRRATPTKAKKSAVPPSLPKSIRGKLPLHKKVVDYVKENPVEVAAEIIAIHPAVRGVKWGAKAVSAAAKSKKLSSLGSKIKSLLKSKPAAKNPFKGPTVPPSKPPGSGLPSRMRSGRGKETPTGKPSGRGSASGGKKPSGPGSRTSRRRTQTPKRETTAARTKRKDARAERRERLDSGGVRMGIQRSGAGLVRGRRTQAQKRAARQLRKRLNL
jgi:hypothetical protein